MSLVGHTLTHTGGKRGYDHRFDCQCGWSAKNPTLTSLRFQYRRHLYDVWPKLGDKEATR